MCNIEECDKPVHAKGLCQPHYRKELRRTRGLQKPGPKPDPGKWRSRYNPDNPHRSRPRKAAKTHCKRGHEYTPDNTLVMSNNRRGCKTCQRDRAAIWREVNLIKTGNFNAQKSHCVNGHPFDEENTFYSKKGSRVCKECARRNAYIMRIKKYGLTVEQFEQMVEQQGDQCAICRRTFTAEPHIDHDHVTGQVRALLCTTCNTGLGAFLDNPDLLQAAIDYLALHRPQELIVN